MYSIFNYYVGFTPISSKSSFLNKTSSSVLCVACEESRCKTNREDLTSKQTYNPRTVLTAVFLLDTNKDKNNVYFPASYTWCWHSSVVLNTSTVQVYRDRLRVWADFLLSFLFFPFFFRCLIFSGAKKSWFVFMSFRSLYAHLPYHKLNG